MGSVTLLSGGVGAEGVRRLASGCDVRREGLQSSRRLLNFKWTFGVSEGGQGQLRNLLKNDSLSLLFFYRIKLHAILYCTHLLRMITVTSVHTVYMQRIALLNWFHTDFGSPGNWSEARKGKRMVSSQSHLKFLHSTIFNGTCTHKTTIHTSHCIQVHSYAC